MARGRLSLIKDYHFQVSLLRKMSGSVPEDMDKSIQTDPQQETSSSSDGKTKKTLKKVGWFALKTAGISAVVLGGVAVAVPAIGFTAGGVAAGSLAAAYQSAFLGGTIASGSAFAVLQSVGAAGLAVSTKAGIVAGAAAASGVHSASKIFKKDKRKENESNAEEKETNENDEVSRAHSASKNLKEDKRKENESNSEEKETNENDETQTKITTGSSKRDASTQTEFDK